MLVSESVRARRLKTPVQRLLDALELTTAICATRRNEKPVVNKKGGQLYPAQAAERGKAVLDEWKAKAHTGPGLKVCETSLGGDDG